MNKNAGISTLKGIGEKTEKLFLKLGVATVDDLHISMFPHKQELLKPHLMPALPLQPKNVFSFPILLSSAGFVFIHILHCLNRSYYLFLYALL